MFALAEAIECDPEIVFPELAQSVELNRNVASSVANATQGEDNLHRAYSHSTRFNHAPGLARNVNVQGGE